VTKTVGDGPGAVEEQREAQQRDGHDGGGPDGHRQAGLLPDPAGHDVAAGPGESGAEAEHQRHERGRGTAADGDDGQPDEPHEDAQLLAGRGPFVQRQRRDDHGEHHLHLQDERRQARRHPEVERGVEQPELADAHEQADEGDVAPGHRGPADEEEGRHEHGDEPKRGEGQRRHVVQADVDDDEVAAPHDGDEDGGEGVADGHAPIVPPAPGADRRPHQRIAHSGIEPRFIATEVPRIRAGRRRPR